MPPSEDEYDKNSPDGGDAMLLWLIEQRQEGARGFRHGQSDPLTVVGPQLLELAPGVRQANGFGHADLEASLVATVFVGTRLARQPSSLGCRRRSFACKPPSTLGEIEHHRLRLAYVAAQ
jgi:hypothetical protein